MRLGCVILAAGNAARFGENKLLTPFRGRPLICRALDAAAGVGEVAVVTQYPAVAELAQRRGYRPIFNPAPELGQSHSVALGVEALGGLCGGLMFLAADQPLLRRATVERLLACFLEDPDRIVVPVGAHGRGNPCVFPASLFPELAALTGDRGGRELLRRCPELVRELPVPERELLDVDTLADLEKILYISDEL